MKLLRFVHWGRKSYHGLPRTDAEALAHYLKATTVKRVSKANAIGTNGVTVWREPVLVKGVVRGLTENGDPAI